MTPEEEYAYLMRNDPDFDRIRRQLAETIKEEQPDAEGIYSSDHEAFLDGYHRIKQRFFNPFDPYNEGLVERARHGDRDAAEQMLVRSGVAESLKGE
jgi:hypothetical protein